LTERDEVTGGWRNLHNEELHDLCSSPSIIEMVKSRRMRLAGRVARLREKRNAYRILVGKPDGKRSLGIPRRRWVNNIMKYAVEMGSGAKICIPGFIKIGSGIQKLIGGVGGLHTDTHDIMEIA
jgi:hypothetical protein